MFHWLIKAIKSNVSEIGGSLSLQVYGVFVAALTPLTFFYWLNSGATQWLGSERYPMCWPFFLECRVLRFLTQENLKIAFFLLFLGSLIPVLLFASRRYIKQAYFLFLLFFILKTLALLLDFRLRLNQHYMASFIAVAFLFFPKKLNSIKILICGFYFWSAILKLDMDWINGTDLYGKIWLLKGDWIKVACIYVVFLEGIGVWGLLSHRNLIRWITFINLFVFHIFSFEVVGYFYPVLMFFILSIFPIDWFSKNESILKFQVQDCLVPVLFSFLQLYAWAFPGDKAVTGEGRFLALNMFDARTQCQATFTIKTKDGNQKSYPYSAKLSERMHCDPYVYWLRGHQLCLEQKQKRADFLDLDLKLESRRLSAKDTKPLVDISNFCEQNPRYSMWKPNSWIQK